MFRVMDFVFLSLLVGFVIPTGVPWAIQSLHERLDPKGVAYEAALVRNQALTVEARRRYISMYLSLGGESANALDSNESPQNESPQSGLADRDDVP